MILSYRGSTDASTWSARLIMLAIAGAVTAAVVLVVRVVWRRALQMPLAAGRRSAWVARRPWWQLAVFYWVGLGVPQLAEVRPVSPARHHGPAVGLLAATCWSRWPVRRYWHW